MTFTVTLHPAERAFDVARDETILSAASAPASACPTAAEGATAPAARARASCATAA